METPCVAVVPILTSFTKGFVVKHRLKKKDMTILELLLAAAIGLVVLAVTAITYSAAFLIGLGIGLTVVTGLVYLLMNVLMPIIGVVYPLTLLQCFVVSLVLMILRILLARMGK